MMMKYNLPTLICLILLAGCGFPKPLATLEEFEQAQTKTYEGISKKEVLHATEKLFMLADPDDVFLSYEDQKLVARRRAILLISVYQENWIIDVQEKAGDSAVTVSVTPTIDGVNFPPRGVGQYALFFSRLDYLLGKSEDWMTCHQYEVRARDEPTWTSSEGILCHIADDNLPEELRPTNTAEM